MNFNTIRRNLDTRSQGFARRHPIFTTIVAIPALTFSVGISVAMGVGFAHAGDAKPQGSTITIQRSGDQYADCLRLAQVDDFAPEVCEGLNPQSRSAMLSCVSEVAYSMPEVDCPKR